MIMFQAVEWLATFVEILTGILVIVRILTEENIRWKESTAAACVITLAIWCLNQYQLFSTMTSLAAIGCWAMSVVLLYKVKLFEALILSINYMILIYIIDFLSISVLGVAFQEKQMADMLTGNFSIMRVVFLFLSKGLLLGMYYYLKTYSLYRFPFKNWKVYILMLSCTAVVYYCVKDTFLSSDKNAVFIWILLLILAILGIISLKQYLNLLQEKREKAVIAERNSIIAESYESMIRNYRENQIFYHDLKNQQLVIENYLKSKNYDKAQEYMRELRFADDMVTVKKWTGIDGLDVLLACKRKVALGLKIEVEIVAEAVTLTISEQELITLLGNAFDNAIEACKKMESKDKWIRITIRKIREMTFFKIANSFEGEPEVKDGKVTSSKKDKNLHGLGLLSMKAIVDKYEGTMGVDYSQGIFSVMFSFFN